MIRRLVATFSVTQIVGYGVLFYSFGVFINPMASELNTSTTTVTGALTVCILVSALASVPVGRWLDRRGGRGLMAGGSALGTVAVIGWANVHAIWQLYAVFVMIGLSHAAVLYDAAFTVLVKRCEPEQRSRSILLVTIVAGLASTVFIPLAGWLGQELGWRNGLLVLASIYGTLTILPHFLLVPTGKGFAFDQPKGHVGQALRDGVFWLLVVSFTANAGAIFATAVHLVGYLLSLGHPIGLAAGVTGLVGVMSVTGRIVTTGLTARFRTSSVVAAIYVVQAVAMMLLPVAGHNLVGAMACILVFGLGFGVANIAKPVLVADRYGASDYGVISGMMAAPMTVAKATAPLAVAVMSVGSLPYVAAAGSLLAAVCLALTGLRASAPAPQPG